MQPDEIIEVDYPIGIKLVYFICLKCGFFCGEEKPHTEMNVNANGYVSEIRGICKECNTNLI